MPSKIVRSYCGGCQAYMENKYCALHYPIEVISKTLAGVEYYTSKPVTYCPKPRTFAQLASCQFWEGAK